MLIEEKIEILRKQVIVHSYIYYECDDNIIDDWIWSEWARCLQYLQEKYPEYSEMVSYEYDQFKDFDWSTGFDFKYSTDIIKYANELMELQEWEKQLLVVKISNIVREVKKND